MPPRCLLVVFLFGIVSKVQMTMEPPTAADSYNTTTDFLTTEAVNATIEHNTRETTGISSVSEAITIADAVTGNSTETVTTGNPPGSPTAPVTGGTTPTTGAETNSSPSNETTNGTASSPPTYITTTGTLTAPTTNSNMTSQPDTTQTETTAMDNMTTVAQSTAMDNMTTVAQSTAMDNMTTVAQSTAMDNMTTQVQITVSNNDTTTDDLTTVTNDNVTTMVAITSTSTDMTTNTSIAPTVNYTTASMTNTPLDNDTAMTTTTNENTTGTFVTVTNNATATTSDNATASPPITFTTHSPTMVTSDNHTSVTEMGNTTALITSTPHSSNMTTTINSATSEQANTTLASSAETSGTPASTVIPFTSTDTKNTTDFSPTTGNFPGSSNTPSTGNATTLSPSPATSKGSNVTMGETTTTTPLPTNSPNNTTETLNTDIPASTAGTTEIFTTFMTTGGIVSSSPTEALTTLSSVIVCPSVPCPVESVCLNGTCQCLSGNYLLNGRCVPAQVFPGRLHFQSLTFEAQMRDRSSRIFQETAANISAALRDVLNNQPGYKRSEVVQLEPGSVIASVNNIFEDSPATQVSVDKLIEEAVKNPEGLLSNAVYTGTNLCEVEPLPCDVSSTKCTNANGQASCSCKDGYISMIYSSTSCKACPSGQQAVRDKCVICPFGYAGFNCNDSSLLAVVVISCVLGGVLLILVLALLGYCCWKRCSRPKPDHNISPYSDELNKSWSIGITPIPRATTHWEPAGSIEMTEGGSTNTLVDKKLESNGFGSQLKQKRWKKSGSYDLNPEEMKTFKGKNTSRYSYLVEGHENPYFLPGDEKRNSTKK